MQTCLITGSSGLIGSEVSACFHERDFVVPGVDNNQREIFFGPQGNTRWYERRLQRALSHFTHHELDIRNRTGVLQLVETLKPSVIIHTAAQPSHDPAAKIPFDDFDVPKPTAVWWNRL
jgi:CDP-paratose 2-epimerase